MNTGNYCIMPFNFSWTTLELSEHQLLWQTDDRRLSMQHASLVIFAGPQGFSPYRNQREAKRKHSFRFVRMQFLKSLFTGAVHPSYRTRLKTGSVRYIQGLRILVEKHISAFLGTAVFHCVSKLRAHKDSNLDRRFWRP
ncbi:MAG: hypothetical protein Greene07147_122 [Parcubacteria group bacterium Greene0714_7]|nr:MAG: hypothetical protein Greene07147_122 [Parcubacteria group bacterium Greene0714_7]